MFHNTNRTKYKKNTNETKYKHDKMQIKTGQNTKVTENKCNKIQMQQNTYVTK